jgi:beta-glucosidase
MMRQVGGTQALSPMMDICNNANWGRMEESFGEDPYLTSRMGLAFVNGLQGNDLRTGVAATTKHFAGYGGKVEDMREFYEETLMPHEVLFKLGGVRNVMPGYHAINGVPAAADKWLLSDVLRNHLQFDGVVVSDYGAVRMVNSRYKYAKDFKEAAVMAIQAGNDIELERAVCTPFFKEALEEGIINIEVINRAVKRSLIMKSRLGLFDKKAFVSEDNNLDFDSPEQRQLAYESASQSIVLLKNNGVLPLKKSIKKIALVGPNATAFQSLLGDYTYQSMRAFFWNTPSIPSDPQLVTLFDGLKAKVGKNITIECERGCDWSDPMEMKLENFGDARVQDAKRKPVEQFSTPDWKKAMEIAKESDVVIAAMGENLYLCGEGRERNGIKLAGDQEEFVKKIAAQGKPVILVIFGGRPQVISNLENHCAAIVQAWFPGEEGGNAVADILLGNINPTGKLCVSYPKHDEKKILSYSRGYDEQNMPHYPFGYGLSYTTYKYSDFKITEKANLSDQWITISCKVKNTGKVDGAEIVQLYVSAAEGLPMAYRKQQLKGFQRIELKKGEEKTIVFKVSPKQFASFIDRKWRVSSGGYTFKIGASSTDIKFEKKIELTGSSLEMEERKYFSH